MKKAQMKFMLLITGLLASTMSLAEYGLNLRKGVTEFSETAYEMHTFTLWICIVIGIVVFGAMIYSIFAHRKSKGYQPEQFSHSTTADSSPAETRAGTSKCQNSVVGLEPLAEKRRSIWSFTIQQFTAYLRKTLIKMVKIHRAVARGPPTPQLFAGKCADAPSDCAPPPLMCAHMTRILFTAARARAAKTSLSSCRRAYGNRRSPVPAPPSARGSRHAASGARTSIGAVLFY